MDADEMLPGAPSRRSRMHRDGARTPVPLVGLIAICAGIGLAYVAQVANATQATYQAAQLKAEGTQLASQAAQLDDQLARDRATERIVAAAQRLGMQPAGHWVYVTGQRVAVLPKPAATAAVATTDVPGDAFQRFIATLGSVVGVIGSATP